MFSRSAKPEPPARDNSILRLKDVVQNNERLRHLPEQFAEVLQRFDNSHCHPALLQDIHSLLSNSVALAEALVDDTIPTINAMQASTCLLGILQRILIHVETARPGRDAYAVLLPATGTFLPSVFASREEAESQVGALRQFMPQTAFAVVPVKVTSQYALQPKSPIKTEYSELYPDIMIPTLPPIQESQGTAIATTIEGPKE